jgi:N-sulfoglucosamine sulfohydrolase
MDIMPTVLEIAGAPLPEKMDGRSLLSLLKGGTQTGRDHVFTTFNYILPWWEVFPMRAVHTRRFSYIFNAWSDGTTRFHGECHGGLTFAAMQAAAKTNPALAARVRHIEYRTPEELYDVEKDPGCLNNLANHPEYAAVKRKMKEMLEEDMRRTQDPLLACFLGKGPIPPELIKTRPPAEKGADS